MRRACRLFALAVPLALLMLAAAPRARAQDAPQAPANAVEVTGNERGQTILVGAGQPLLVRLDPSDVWSVAIDDETVLQPTTLPDGLPDGVQAAFTALTAGTTALTATGTAHCAPGVPCPQFAFLFTATVRVLPEGTTVIGPDANGGTIAIAQGDTLIVQLGPGFLWTFNFSPDGVLVPVAVDPGLGPTVQQVLLAEGTGSVDVEATGTPNCPPNQPCPAIAAIFSTTIVVQ